MTLLDNALPAGVENEQSPNCRVLRFPPVSPLLDEDARLCSLSVFDAFRLLQNLLNVPKEEREAMFFGGLFSYDLVAGFENLPQLSAENSCPDFCFYLAETLMVIDHQKKSTRIQASLFAPNEEEKQRLTARLNELRQQLTEAAPPLPVVSVPHMRCECNQSDEEFGGVVRLLQKAIRAGEIFQVVPSRRFSLPCPSPLAAYYVLKKSNPSPYMFLCRIMISPCLARRRKVRSSMTPPAARLRFTRLPEHVHAVVVPMVRWTGPRQPHRTGDAYRS